MKLIQELPHLCAHCRDGSSWLLPLEERDSFEFAWTNGLSFWNGLSARGSRITIKLADITGMSENTQEVLDQIAAERAEEEHRKLLTGE